MSIKWKDIWSEALQAAEAVVEIKAPAVKETLKSVAAARERRLKLLMTALADGALDKQAIDDELKDEQAMLEAEFLAIRVLGKKAAQDAANAVIGTITKALVKGIDIIV
jgi:hypothetical protein